MAGSIFGFDPLDFSSPFEDTGNNNDDNNTPDNGWIVESDNFFARPLTNNGNDSPIFGNDHFGVNRPRQNSSEHVELTAATGIPASGQQNSGFMGLPASVGVTTTTLPSNNILHNLNPDRRNSVPTNLPASVSASTTAANDVISAIQRLNLSNGNNTPGQSSRIDSANAAIAAAIAAANAAANADDSNDSADVNHDDDDQDSVQEDSLLNEHGRSNGQSGQRTRGGGGPPTRGVRTRGVRTRGQGVQTRGARTRGGGGAASGRRRRQRGGLAENVPVLNAPPVLPARINRSTNYNDSGEIVDAATLLDRTRIHNERLRREATEDANIEEEKQAVANEQIARVQEIFDELEANAPLFLLTAEEEADFGIFNADPWKTKVRRLQQLYRIYSNPRFAPRNAINTRQRIERFLQNLNLHLPTKQSIVKPYCGDGFLLPTHRMGTESECFSIGRKVGDKHGYISASFPFGN